MAKKRNKLLIVDGYNVLRSGQRYVHMRREEDYTHETFNKVREALISDVAAFCRGLSTRRLSFLMAPTTLNRQAKPSVSVA